MHTYLVSTYQLINKKQIQDYNQPTLKILQETLGEISVVSGTTYSQQRAVVEIEFVDYTSVTKLGRDNTSLSNY